MLSWVGRQGRIVVEFAAVVMEERVTRRRIRAEDRADHGRPTRTKSRLIQRYS